MNDVDAPRLETLRSLPLFAGLSADAIGRVCRVCTEFEVPGGHVLVQPGSEGSGLFIIEQGEAEVEVGTRRITCGAGECIGELSLLADGIVHVARVRAKSPLHGIAISRSDFTTLVHEEPQVAVAMLEVLARRLAQTDQILSQI